MNTKHVVLRSVACLALFAADQILVALAVEVGVAGALLSPSSAVALEAFAVALAFLACRAALVLSLASAAAWTVADAVRALLRPADPTAEPARA
ncbi:MAG: hypothetical protein KF729_27085 [Sandaracinaceae bacterium]|nr:hypothetical protein [Sandaracinaceae bacterium]